MPSGGCLPAKSLEARHLEDVGSGCEGFGWSVVADDRGNLVLAVAEVKGLRIWVAEREGVSESAGEARKVAERVGRRRQQVERRGDVPVLWLGAADRTLLGSVGRPPAPRVVDVARPS